MSSTERSLTQLSSYSVANLSREVTALQEQFTSNQMRLAIIRNTTNQTDQLSDRLIQVWIASKIATKISKNFVCLHNFVVLSKYIVIAHYSLNIFRHSLYCRSLLNRRPC